MPIFFQQEINAVTRLGIWKIEETEEFFKSNVPQHRDVTHPHKRLQHLAGRFLLQYLVPAFPYELVEIADTRKPFLPGEQYHFSISHCGDYAAAIVSKDSRVGIDIEIPVEKIMRIRDKFLSEEEKSEWQVENGHPMAIGWSIGNRQSVHVFRTSNPGHPIPNSQTLVSHSQLTTLLWSAKEAVFKWYGEGGVDFSEHIQLQQLQEATATIDCFFSKDNSRLIIHYRLFDHIVLAWVMS